MKEKVEWPTPTSRIEEITFENGQVRIGEGLDREAREGLINLLNRIKDLFAWELKDLVVVDLNLANIN